jgi:hypothetical protein
LAGSLGIFGIVPASALAGWLVGATGGFAAPLVALAVLVLGGLLATLRLRRGEA